jgi:hypothetical protein
LEIWLYEDGYRPLLLYFYNPQTYGYGLYEILLRTSF